jgi:hypothetical protein
MSTLSELSRALIEADEVMDPDEFDPALLVGELKDKVDSVKWKIDQWEAEAKALQENWIEPLLARQKALKTKADKLREYCAFVLKRDELEVLPGNAFALKLRKSESVEVDLEPTAQDALRYDFVRTKITYAWDKKALAAKLKAKEELPFCRLRTNFSAQFQVKKD